jgi:Protein of unknown function (DUF3563)
MFTMLMNKIEEHFVGVDNMRRDAYLGAATDLADLERRSRSWEENHAPFSLCHREDLRDWRD